MPGAVGAEAAHYGARGRRGKTCRHPGPHCPSVRPGPGPLGRLGEGRCGGRASVPGCRSLSSRRAAGIRRPLCPAVRPPWRPLSPALCPAESSGEEGSTVVRKERRREAPNPMIQKVRSLRGTVPAGGCVGPVYPSQPLSVCLFALQTRRCTKERPSYALSSSDEDDPSKEIGVTYRSTRSAVRTEHGLRSGGLADLNNLLLQMCSQLVLVLIHRCVSLPS